MAGHMRVPRTRGLLSGSLLVLLGAWGALIAFIGPYFDFAYTPDSAWTYTNDRLWLLVLPGAGAFLGGLIVLGSANRAFASFGGWLAAVSGAWFVVSLPLSALSGMPQPGSPTGGTTRQTLETLTFFSGLGAVIIFLAALALGRFAVVGVREAQAAERAYAEDRLSTVDGASYYDDPAAGTAPARQSPAAADEAGMVTHGTDGYADRPADSYPADRPANSYPAESYPADRSPMGGRNDGPGERTDLPAAPPVSDATTDADESPGLRHRMRRRHAAHASAPHDEGTSQQ